MGSKKYGITFLLVGILIVSYLSFTFSAGMVYTIKNYQYLYSHHYWDQIKALSINVVLNFIVLVIFVMVFIIPGVFLIKNKRKSK